MARPKGSTNKKTSNKSVSTKSRSKNLPAKVQPSIDVDVQKLMEIALDTEDIERINKILDLRDRVIKEYAEKAYREAMAKFQAECPVIPKKTPVYNKDGKTVRYYYAKIDAIIKTAGPILANNDFSFNMKTENTFDPLGVGATVTLSHIGGHSESRSFWVPLDTNEWMSEQQRWKSSKTFASRVAFCDVTGIATADEDNDTNNPGKGEIEEWKTDKAQKMMNELPDKIADGFRHLGYSQKAVFILCEREKWDHAKIGKRVNSIIDSQVKSGNV